MTATYQEVIDSAPPSRFHKRLVVACCGGPFLDGYIISIIGVALVGISGSLLLSSSDSGMAGAAALVGIGLGALLFGALTDRIGREKMYAVDLTVLVVGSVLCALVNEAWQLIVLRLILGLAIGADLPIATSLMTEFAPARRRGMMLGFAAVAWAAGGAAAYLVGWIMVELSGGYGLWRWMLASGAVFALLVVVLRRNVPESPRWLASKGRITQAQAVVRRIYGVDVDEAGFTTRSSVADTAVSGLGGLRVLFRGGYLKRTIMCTVLYIANVTPNYAIFIFAPVLLANFHLSGGSLDVLGGLVITVLSIVGAFPALRWIETAGRRKTALIPLTVTLVPFVALWLVPEGPAWFVIVAFSLYALTIAGPGMLIWSYPNEIFPTEVRATALGFMVAASRIGAVVGTYLLPVGLETIGAGNVMLIAAILTAAAIVVCYFWAPETRGLALDEAAGFGHARVRKPVRES
ncbi:MFS transporter [Amycolatopsis pithecellobii]|uniref:MFS transporter n=1 Tax=Amycolatopsis pithecellobii TaxID=664692 RepID=A0A6N7Z6V1_9PSEU|nr:MFS transporter [Amycolatopsis pithecellobii]MTD56600.1 MFS transporter [Amycolatopsis pithecellobii]